MALTERLALVVEVVTTKAQGQVERLGASVGGLGARAQAGLGRVQGQLDKVGLGSSKASVGADKLGAALAGVGGTAGAAAAGVAAVAAAGAAFAAKGVRDFASFAAEVKKFRDMSGASVEESSQFVALLDDFEVSAEAGANAMFKLGRSVATNDDGLKKLGITVAKNNDGSTNLIETFLNVADAVAKTPDPAKRAELAMTAFGRSGAELLPVLQRGREGLAEFAAEARAQKLTDEDLIEAEEMRLALDGLNDAVSVLSRNLGGGLAPVITDVSELLTSVVQTADSAAGPLGGLGNVIAKAWQATNPIGALAGVRDAWRDLRGAKDEDTKATDANTRATRTWTQAQEEATEAIEKARDAVTSRLDAQVAAQSAAGRVAKAEEALAEAHEEGARKVQALADANEDLRSAREGVAAAERDLAEARRNAPLLQRERELTAREAADAVADAHTAAALAVDEFGSQSDEAQEATESLERAQLDLEKANAEVAKGSDEVAEAERRVAEAKAAVEQAQRRLNEAQALDNTAAVRKATEDLNLALYDREKALLRIIDAQRALNELAPGLTVPTDVAEFDDFLRNLDARLLEGRTAAAVDLQQMERDRAVRGSLTTTPVSEDVARLDEERLLRAQSAPVNVIFQPGSVVSTNPTEAARATAREVAWVVTEYD